MTFVIAHVVLTAALSALLLLVITVQNAARLLRRVWPSAWDGTERRLGGSPAWHGVDRRHGSFA